MINPWKEKSYVRKLIKIHRVAKQLPSLHDTVLYKEKENSMTKIELIKKNNNSVADPDPVLFGPWIRDP